MKESPLLKIEELKTYFPVRKSFFSLNREKKFVHAVDNVSLIVKKGEIFGLAGESGSGKTTIGKTILRLVKPSGGRILYQDRDILSLKASNIKKLRRNMQMIFQDPYESLNPRHSVFDIVSEPLRVNNLPGGSEKVFNTLEAVDLNPPQDFTHKFPHELSGGQRQRVAIAAALILEPEFIIADEPVSMLDVSIKAEILNLILKLRRELDLTFLLITHDLSVIRHMTDRVAIMYLGKIVEKGNTIDVIDRPLHQYTKAMISIIPSIMSEIKRDRIILKGEIPNSIDLPSGCRFHPRCPRAKVTCKQIEPELIEVKSDHCVACNMYKR